MKIMIVTPYFYPKIGGVENYTLSLAKGLIDKGHEVFVITTNVDKHKYEVSNHSGVRIFRLPIAFTISNTPINFLWYLYLKKIIDNEKPDVINAHSPVPFMADVAFAARGNAKFVITYHSGSLKKGKSILMDLALGFYEKTCLRNILHKSDSIISVYPKFIETIIGEYGNIHFIPPGIDTSFFRPAPKKSSKTILFVGRIEQASAWKGVGVLINAAAIVIKNNPSVNIKLVGDGDAIEFFRKQTIRLGIDSNTVFTGPLNGQELIDAYQTANMLVLPSITDSESFGIVLIEAMSCELPVIGSDIGGIPNVIIDDKTGLLVKANKPTRLAEAIQTLFDNPELSNKLGVNGRQRVINNFSINQLIDRTDRLFRKIVL